MAKKKWVKSKYKWHGVTYDYGGNTIGGTSTTASVRSESGSKKATKNDT